MTCESNLWNLFETSHNVNGHSYDLVSFGSNSTPSEELDRLALFPIPEAKPKGRHPAFRRTVAKNVPIDHRRIF